jgi:hypothetical protein
VLDTRDLDALKVNPQRKSHEATMIDESCIILKSLIA